MGVAGYAYYQNVERADPKYAFLTGVLDSLRWHLCAQSCGLLLRHHESRAGWHTVVCQSKATQAGYPV